MYVYSMKVCNQWREFDLRSLAELPIEIASRATANSVMWDCLTWGMIDSQNLDILDHAPMRIIKDLWKEWQKDSDIHIQDIGRLLSLISKYRDSLEDDLISKGLRLRDCPSPQFNWRDLSIIVKFSGPHSKSTLAVSPKDFGWDRTNMLLADIADSLHWLVWAKTEKAQKGGDPPDLIPRPGVQEKEIREGSKTTPIPISRIREMAGLVDLSDEEREIRNKKTALAFKR